MHAVGMQCKVLYVGNPLNPSFGDNNARGELWGALLWQSACIPH